MNNEELKKKILSIVRGAMIEADELPFIEETEHIANALIAAELTFDGEWKHRAEVAEKELLVYKEVAGAMLCEIECSNEGYCPEFYKDPECENCTKKKIYGNSAATSPCLFDKYIRQAEKELAEEGKDD